ncbi:MAG: cellulase family glycosylhydrolase [Bacteroidota bacterium]
MKKTLWVPVLLLLLGTGSMYAAGAPGEGGTVDLTAFCSSQKGFNLPGKFDVSWSNTGYTEKEFSMINQLGFNFVRLPIDYRTYTQPGDWDAFVESEVEEIDDAIGWGSQYDVHVCVNLHRAPGYCVNSGDLPASQQLNLWEDTIAQKAFIRHWEYFADRYREVAAEKLSFNLVNEPSNVREEVYVELMTRAVEAIHAISPDRIVFVDGMNYGRDLIPALKEIPGVAQSMHCYDPFGLTHYKAEWVDGSANWPEPVWPVLPVSNYLYGPWKSEFSSTLVIEGDFPEGTEVTVNVGQVSIESNLLVRAGSKTILSRHFLCSADTGADFSRVVETEWGFQNISNKDFSGVSTEAATLISFENSLGDWMTLNYITIKISDRSFTFYPGDGTWGKKQDSFKMDAQGKLTAADGSELLLFETYQDNIALAEEHGIAFMVQEFGVYNKTPHDVTIAFLSDLMKLLNGNRIGWSLWNFIDSFGILNSSRTDCTYEAFEGYQLDAEMLEVLRNTSTPVLRTEPGGRMEVYPSPASGFIMVSSKEFRGKTELCLLSLAGQLLKCGSFEANGSGSSFRMNVGEVAPGIYLLSAISGGRLFMGKVIIVH